MYACMYRSIICMYVHVLELTTCHVLCVRVWEAEHCHPGGKIGKQSPIKSNTMDHPLLCYQSHFRHFLWDLTRYMHTRSISL